MMPSVVITEPMRLPDEPPPNSNRLLLTNTTIAYASGGAMRTTSGFASGTLIRIS